MFKTIVLLVIGVAVGFGVYVRLAPSDRDVWHRTFYPLAPGDYVERGAFKTVRAVADAQATMAALDEIIRATPRTTVLAGAVEEGLITYVTRSNLWGFPDYTTVYAGADDTVEGGFGPLLKVHGRLRFGLDDLGVNKARVEGWLAQLESAEAR